MWMMTACRPLGAIDVSALTERVLDLPGEVWADGEYLRQQLTLARQTNSIFIRSMPTQSFETVLADRALTAADVQSEAGATFFDDILDTVLDQVVLRACGEGLVLRAQFARMRPGAQIKPHKDSSLLLSASHRLHIPLVTNDQVEFTIGGETLRMEAGHLYELNNRVRHSVVNGGAQDRIHLILDVLPKVNNHPDTLKRGFELCLKQRQFDRTAPPPAARLDVALPRVLATSVVRGAQKTESHGGVYLVDMQTGKHEQVVDWNTTEISWEGRGWDRGLRGIAFYKGQIFIAASDELFCFDQKFEIVASWRNPYLRHAHEIHVHGDALLVTSTGFDSVLSFNLRTKEFDKAWLIRPTNDGKVGVAGYDPRIQGPDQRNQLHINSVFQDASGLYVGARAVPFLLRIGPDGSKPHAILPTGTHNARPFGSGTLFNHTNEDMIAIEHGAKFTYLEVPIYPAEALQNLDLGDEKLARQGFGRGLCLFGNDVLIAGSSPSTITAWDLTARAAIKSVNLSMDIRNAIHGLEVWPF